MGMQSGLEWNAVYVCMYRGVVALPVTIIGMNGVVHGV